MSELLEAPTEPIGEELEPSHETEIQPSAPEASKSEVQAVCATLYLPRQKGERRVTVHGWSGKYEFKWCPERRKIVRDYTSPATFLREEEDIRKRVGNPVVVCTLLGSTDLAANAKEAVQCLIDARLKVARDNRLAVLMDLAGMVGAAIAELETPNEEEETGELLPPELAQRAAEIRAQIESAKATSNPEGLGEIIKECVATPAFRYGLDEKEEEARKQVIEDERRKIEEERATLGFHGFAEPTLMKLPFDDLKAVARRFGVKMSPPSRTGIVKDLLPYYRAGAPTSWV